MSHHGFLLRYHSFHTKLRVLVERPVPCSTSAFLLERQNPDWDTRSSKKWNGNWVSVAELSSIFTAYWNISMTCVILGYVLPSLNKVFRRFVIQRVMTKKCKNVLTLLEWLLEKPPLRYSKFWKTSFDEKVSKTDCHELKFVLSSFPLQSLERDMFDQCSKTPERRF